MKPETFARDPLEFSSRRSPVYGRGGMVAASQPLAAAAGTQILAQGGTAADAAVAVAAALNVTEPTSTGLGGDCFALYYSAATGEVSALNGSGRAPAALTLERLRREGLGEALPPMHPYTITVPGACAGWCDLAARFGRLPLGDILAPAIELAEGGFPVAPVTSYFWQRAADGQLARALNGRELTLDGRGPRPGEIFRNPGLGQTLRRIAAGGAAAFYQGDIAAAIAATVAEAGGCLSLADLATHASTWEQPISVEYRGHRVWECPPNGQGLAALLALNILRQFDLSALPPLSVERLHLQIEAMRLAFADAFYYIADPAFCPAPLAGLLSAEYGRERAALIDPRRTRLNVAHGTPPAVSDTVYFCVVDGAGNACSFINSNYMGFGTGIVPHGWGFSLQNRGHNFSLDPQHPNALAPGKRPYHTIIPGLITRADGSLYGPFGVMGGFMQPQGHLQTAISLLDDGWDPQAALDLPRFCIEPAVEGGRVALEAGIPEAVAAALVDLGQPVHLVSGWGRALFGRGQIIVRDPATGVLCGGSDPRADGCARVI
ncbi:MAG TPA: gamma-glutamyltransferase family protein [Anaerolineaceae bacterium]|nr:gamma-glutamyltransferase family protein [Anaerolineaceae bacterium]HOD04092.1 gamma-glutamyltransferase family protein [Anaerolineaceae bacterium]